MQRIMPSMSSRSNMAYLVCVLPGRGFLVCENLIDESMPPSITSVRCGSRADVGRGVRAVGGQRLLVLGQRMAGEIEAQHFLLGGQPLAVVPLGHVGQRRAARPASSSFVHRVEQALLAALAIGVQRRRPTAWPDRARPSVASGARRANRTRRP